MPVTGTKRKRSLGDAETEDDGPSKKKLLRTSTNGTAEPTEIVTTPTPEKEQQKENTNKMNTLELKQKDGVSDENETKEASTEVTENDKMVTNQSASSSPQKEKNQSQPEPEKKTPQKEVEKATDVSMEVDETSSASTKCAVENSVDKMDTETESPKKEPKKDQSASSSLAMENGQFKGEKKENIFSSLRLGRSVPKFSFANVLDPKFPSVSDTDMKGTWTVLVFFPNAFVSTFRDFLLRLNVSFTPKFMTENKAQIMAISTESPYALRAFCEAPKEMNGLNKEIENIILGSDLNQNMSRDFSVFIQDKGLVTPSVFIIDSELRIQYFYEISRIDLNDQEFFIKKIVDQFISVKKAT